MFRLYVELWLRNGNHMLTNNTARLNSEMDYIHFANRLFWASGEAVTIEARAEYQLRRERLEEIRAELAQLQTS